MVSDFLQVAVELAMSLGHFLVKTDDVGIGLMQVSRHMSVVIFDDLFQIFDVFNFDGGSKTHTICTEPVDEKLLSNLLLLESLDQFFQNVANFGFDLGLVHLQPVTAVHEQVLGEEDLLKIRIDLLVQFVDLGLV
jgi:hypothetical protein